MGRQEGRFRHRSRGQVHLQGAGSSVAELQLADRRDALRPRRHRPEARHLGARQRRRHRLGHRQGDRLGFGCRPGRRARWLGQDVDRRHQVGARRDRLHRCEPGCGQVRAAHCRRPRLQHRDLRRHARQDCPGHPRLPAPGCRRQRRDPRLLKLVPGREAGLPAQGQDPAYPRCRLRPGCQGDRQRG